MSKLLLFDEAAREKLLKGVNTLTEAVATTLGPKGRNVAIDQKWSAPKVIHDGVSVAKEVELEDPFENMGAKLVKEAASKTNDAAGDGTTTATILTQSIVFEGLKNIQAGCNPMILKKGIDKTVDVLVKELGKISKQITTKEEILQIATISAQNPEIGEIISESIKKVGKDGIITVAEGSSTGISVDVREGMQFDKGFLSPYFVTDTDKNEATIDEPYILITDKKLTAGADLVPFLSKFVNTSKDLVIIADTVDGDCLPLLVLNKIRGTLNVLVVQAPGFGDRRKEILEDLAILTGTTIISDSRGDKLEELVPEQLGRAGRVTSTKDLTVVVDGRGKPTDIKSRVEIIRKQLETNDSSFEIEKLQERLARLTGGVAVISVGATTEVEMKEKKERVIDAVAATRAAIEEGIVPGGETTLLAISSLLSDGLGLEGEEKIGVDIVRRALQQPFRRLLKNAGLDDGAFLSEVMKLPQGEGVDVLDGKIKNLVEAGIIDPVKVVRCALQNAASVATMCMTTNVLIVDKEESATK